MRHLIVSTFLLIMVSPPAMADWNFSGPPNANAFIQEGNMTLELRCDRVRFTPAGYEDTQDIVAKQGLSFRFMKDGSTEVGAFQAGSVNADISLVDNYPVEVRFFDQGDYDFILDQIAQNAVLNLSMVDHDVSYGIFSLQGSSATIKSLRASCGSNASISQGNVYCGVGAVQGVIEYAITGQSGDQWDAVITVNGETVRAMTSYSFFGNTEPPAGFQVALLAEDRSELIVFSDGGLNWIEYGDYTYEQCN
jgi:hypothetical protein